MVDDAIVVVENVERWIEKGFSPREAARKAMDEVGGAIISIAVVLTAVFGPTALVSGISGQFYRQFAVTIAIAVGPYNVYPAALIQGTTLPGVNAGQAIGKMERICRENLPCSRRCFSRSCMKIFGARTKGRFGNRDGKKTLVGPKESDEGS